MNKHSARILWAHATDAFGDELSLVELILANSSLTPAEAKTLASELDSNSWDGSRSSDESWTVWATFPVTVSDEAALYTLGCPSDYYRGPGRGFAHSPSIRRSPSRLLVVWSGGLDI